MCSWCNTASSCPRRAASFLTSHFGLDYAHLRGGDGKTLLVPVQRGQNRPLPYMADGVEILSGLSNGDIMVRP